MKMLTALIRSPSDRLMILGAGNCNDVELSDLAKRFSQVYLVDIDPKAARSAVDRQVPEEGRSRIVVSPSTDVTGVLNCFDDTELDKILADAIVSQLAKSTHIELADHRFECVASTCLMSQLIDSMVMGLGAHSEGMVKVIQALRMQHLLLMVEQLVPGGRGVLVFDFVSTETLPELLAFSSEQLARQLMAAIQAKNFFTGLNPFAIRELLLSDPVLSPQLHQIQLHDPWRWQIPNKAFGVAAISFVKRDR
jgi:hypothetical protein